MFEAAGCAERQLLRDKHTLLEGYVTEYLFERQFLLPEPDCYTGGWWSAVAHGQRYFFLVSDHLNAVDQAVLDTLSPHFPCYRAYPKDDTWYFYENGQGEGIPMEQFLARCQLSAIRPVLKAAAGVRNSERQNRCIDFFASHGLLRKIAVERNFADDFLSVYFDAMVNVDFFTLRRDGRLSAVEVKFKYESASGKFGINVGQLQLFSLLESLGVQIQHWILYNDAHDKNLSIFGFLERSDLDRHWRYGLIPTDRIRERKIAPSETSVTGQNQQPYYELDQEELKRERPLLLCDEDTAGEAAEKSAGGGEETSCISAESVYNEKDNLTDGGL